MNTFNIALKVSNILLTLLMLSGCGVVKLSGFRSDEEILGIFNKNKVEITAVMKKCKSFNNPVERKERTRENFDSCKIDPETLKRIQTQEVYKGYTRPMIDSEFFNGSPILFKMEEVELLGVDVFLEEKGYVFFGNTN
jgi:hypothetical protein